MQNMLLKRLNFPIILVSRHCSWWATIEFPWITHSYIFCNKAKETLPSKSQNFKGYSGYVNKVLLKCQRKKYGTWRTQAVPAGTDPVSKLHFCSIKGNDISFWPNQGLVRPGSQSSQRSLWETHGPQLLQAPDPSNTLLLLSTHGCPPAHSTCQNPIQALGFSSLSKICLLSHSR